MIFFITAKAETQLLKFNYYYLAIDIM